MTNFKLKQPATKIEKARAVAARRLRGEKIKDIAKAESISERQVFRLIKDADRLNLWPSVEPWTIAYAVEHDEASVKVELLASLVEWAPTIQAAEYAYALHTANPRIRERKTILLLELAILYAAIGAPDTGEARGKAQVLDLAVYCEPWRSPANADWFFESVIPICFRVEELVEFASFITIELSRLLGWPDEPDTDKRAMPKSSEVDPIYAALTERYGLARDSAHSTLPLPRPNSGWAEYSYDDDPDETVEESSDGID